MTAIEKAAQLGAEHSQFTAVRLDPCHWLNDPALENVASSADVDLTDKDQWDAYCAALYLGLMTRKSRAVVARVVDTATRALTF
jgi:hypothetical protein